VYPIFRVLQERLGWRSIGATPPIGERKSESISSPAADAAALALRAGSSTCVPDERPVLVRIAAALEEVRPAIRMDGGDIELIGYQAGVVTVKLKGACRSCPMSEMTLQLGVERLLRQLVPEIERVESI
jgi:Fe-S cluster biogenesis protein NfuA